MENNKVNEIDQSDLKAAANRYDRENWLDQFHQGQKEVRNVQRELIYLSNSLYVVGMVDLGDKISNLANSLEVAENQIGEAVSFSIHKSVKESKNTFNQVTALVLTTLLKKEGN